MCQVSVSLTMVISEIGFCSLSVLWVLVSAFSCHDSRIDKKRNILTYFSNIYKKNSQSFSDDKVFNLWEALCTLDETRALALL